ncbi:MAG: DUF2461 domain-containing protein [Pseudomonadota bacterium]
MHLRELTQFLTELSENNNRPWFIMNKPRYDILREEFLTLVSHLILDVAKFDAEVADCNPKKALFRINRDMRFSHDKSPYKTNFSASIVPNGRKKPSDGGGPAYYFHVDEAGSLLFAVGEYMPPADRLRAVRQHIVADAAGFAKVLKDKSLARAFGGLQEEGKLTRPPKGFDPDLTHIEYIKLKNFIVWKEMPLNLANSDELKHLLANSFKDAFPLVSWLRGAKTPSVET